MICPDSTFDEQVVNTSLAKGIPECTWTAHRRRLTAKFGKVPRKSRQYVAYTDCELQVNGVTKAIVECKKLPRAAEVATQAVPQLPPAPWPRSPRTRRVLSEPD